MPNSATTRSSTYSPPNSPRGTPRTGRIVTLLTGKGHGFIRLPNAREVYFHRADLPGLSEGEGKVRTYFFTSVDGFGASAFLKSGLTSRVPFCRNGTPLSIHSGRGLPSR